MGVRVLLDFMRESSQSAPRVSVGTIWISPNGVDRRRTLGEVRVQKFGFVTVFLGSSNRI